MAERLARQAFTTRFGPAAAAVSVSSAGVVVYPGDPMSRRSARILREFGADDTTFRSRQVDAGMLGAADLVLTATRSQRSFCAQLAPVLVRRMFTLRQFARLADAVD